MSSSFADGAEVPVTEAALPRWMATLRRWKRKVTERGSEVVARCTLSEVKANVKAYDSRIQHKL